MSSNAFLPGTPSFLVVATSAPGAPTQVVPWQGGLRATNASTSSLSVFLAIGTSTVVAAAPTTGVPAAGLCLLAGASINLFVPPAATWVSAATTGGSAPLYLTAGFGTG